MKKALNTVFLTAGVSLLLLSCASTSQQLPPEPPRYVYPAEIPVQPSRNSLWSDKAGLFEDVKARGLNDILTINIVERASASKDAETRTSRASSIDIGAKAAIGMPPDFNLDNFFSASSGNSFTGRGKTTRAGTLVATIAARVINVLPNGNFGIEARKEITVNREKQILILRGIIRPEDITSDNTILSTQVADARMIFTGKGVVQDKQGQGWLVRVMDKVWPF